MSSKGQSIPNLTNSVYVGGDASGNIVNVSGNQAPNDYSELLRLLRQLEEEAAKLPFKQDEKAELFAEIKTVEAQISSPKPKSVVISKSWKTIRTLAEGVISNALYQGLAGFMSRIIT